jgi:hypothetical protein
MSKKVISQSIIGKSRQLSIVLNLVIICSGLISAEAQLFQVTDFDCLHIEELGIEKQMNQRADAILKYCREKSGEADAPISADTTFANFISSLTRAESIFGGTDTNLITGTETFPKVTQSTSASWGHGNTIVVVYNDSSGSNLSPVSYCGVSVSTDGGATFTRLPYKFNNGGACYGDPSVFYSIRAAKWYVSFIFAGCGSQGIGQWESSDGVNWTTSGCVHTGTSDSHPKTWVDNNPGSPYYGRQYAAFNDFAAGQGIFVTSSTNDGVNWSAPVTVFSTFRRIVGITGSFGTDGTVFIQAMDEGGGGLTNRQNWIYRSTNGGASWSGVTQGAVFPGPGRSACGYFAAMYSSPSAYWRYMGWGQPGVGPSGVVHYVYSARDTTTGDPANIFYIRSINNGTNWSAPLKLNTDTTTRAQWQPSLSVNAQGKIFVSWYDERNTTNNSLQRFGRASSDNGATWGNDEPISDVVYPVPIQPDGAVQPCYAGDYDHASFSNDNNGDIAYHTWTDGRVVINSSPQQDVFFDRINLGATAATATVGGRVFAGKDRGVSKARVILTDSSGATRYTMTNSFGYYRFDGVEVGQTYIFSVSHKRYQFAPQIFTVNEDLTELNFMAEP